MSGMVFIGMILFLIGMYSVIRGKMPFIKNYNGVNKQALHCRIEGGAALFAGIIFIASYYLHLQPLTLLICLVGLCIIAVGLEIVFRVI